MPVTKQTSPRRSGLTTDSDIAIDSPPVVELTKQVGFARKPLRCGGWWYLVATHPSGQQEDVAGFQSEIEALEWLAGSKGLRAWLNSRGYEGWFRTGPGTFR